MTSYQQKTTIIGMSTKKARLLAVRDGDGTEDEKWQCTCRSVRRIARASVRKMRRHARNLTSRKAYQAAAASLDVLPNFSEASLALAISVWIVSWMLLIRMVARATGAATTAAPANEDRVHTAEGARRAEDTAATPLTKPIILEKGRGGKKQRRIGVVVVEGGEGE